MPLRLFLFVLLALGAVARAEELSYRRDVQPIFTAKCVACHACYDSPCQLNLGSGEGVQRGAHKLPVYNGLRTEAQATTRLFLDAEGEAAWRRKGFHSVLGADGQAALLARMLELGRRQPLEHNARLPEDLEIGIGRQNSCPLPGEFAAFARDNPRAGMPFAVTGLTDGEYAILKQWLAQGAPVDAAPLEPSPAEAAQIADWERLLNAQDKRSRLVARWLYEHLFLAHLHFEGGAPGHFFQLVRSRTPAGQPVEPIATRRPNDDPGSDFHYRLRPIHDVIVHKTHITYPLGPQKLARVRELFLSGDWQVTKLPGYGAQRRANPFETFAAIPAQARYRFMLDNAEYFVRTFIRGPVCRGQIASDVIRDHFWTLFQAPEQDRYLTDAQYRSEVTPLLVLPGQLDDIAGLWSLWGTYMERLKRYESLRRQAYAEHPAEWADLWSGNDNALLTVFRQHDSASVRKGLVGAVPQTLWWLDFPLFERTYYQLVANFDVFGNLSHQLQTRLYYDLIRNGAEQNFLRLLPAGTRQAILDSWYENSGQLKLWLAYTEIDGQTPSALGLPQHEPIRSFAAHLLERHAAINARPDPLNRCRLAHCHRPGVARELQYAEQALSRLASRPAASLPAVLELPEASLLRIEYGEGRREIYSLLRNRAHSNVAFIFGEQLRYQPALDSLTLYPGVLSSYPNFLFNVRAEEVPAFVAALEQARPGAGLAAVVERWGIRRSHPEFWRYFNDLSAWLRETEPLEAGVLDMNRYQNL
ncbi:fatty acid cis/trans isomerase [Azotobacter chroococcum]|uniref:Fatty acid cis/trans isomerase CTI n=1 Tax=Azotobacter chroococcum TaxID=353 RepID=A0A4R1PTI4_9GAMM|nr:fatty acid cis/trans isomerase [Azotobacter chroococcum]TBV99407.1 peptidylprolyl isomerase [Azotobacter chroococcum]TCL31175.1 fatty acid cis/trans isomerase CTI [Azotobacter chroococcum]